MSKSPSQTLAERLRSRLNSKNGTEYARSFSTQEELMQVKCWITLKPFFKRASGGEGFPCGHITQIIGEPDSGKTTLMMEGMVSCQKLGGVVYLIDSEHKFSLERLALMGGDPREVIVIQVESLEEAWAAISDVCSVVEEERTKAGNFPVMLCWDSIAASVPDRILEEDTAGDSHVAVEAKINNKNIRKLRQFIKKTDIACVFINHFYSTMPMPGRPPREIIKGGEELTFMSTLIVKTKKGEKIEIGSKDKTKIGRVTKFEITKGHFHGITKVDAVSIVGKGILESEEELADYIKSLKTTLKGEA